MEYNNRKFMIFNVNELTKVNFNEVMETSIETVRKSVDESKTFVKWDSEKTPNSVDSLITKEGPYTYSEMMLILETEEWLSPEKFDYI